MDSSDSSVSQTTLLFRLVYGQLVDVLILELAGERNSRIYLVANSEKLHGLILPRWRNHVTSEPTE